MRWSAEKKTYVLRLLTAGGGDVSLIWRNAKRARVGETKFRALALTVELFKGSEYEVEIRDERVTAKP
jgi:hypothetical protein